MEGGKPSMQALKERQSVYLFCASEGLVTVFRAYVDREVVSKALGLRPDQKVLFSQTVGYPQK
jgi:nitroreductase